MDAITLAASLMLGISLVVPVILDGFERKIKAALQSRIGPPVLQTLYDILKLASKEYKPLHTNTYVVMSVVAYIVCSAVSLAYAFLYILTGGKVYFIYSIALFAIAAATHTATPLLVPNPFSQVGAWREVVLSVINENAFVFSMAICLALPSLGLAVGSAAWLIVAMPVLFLLLVSSYVATGRAPFDLAEAEPELASGVLVEFSGPLLALNLYSMLLKRFLVKTLTASSIITVAATFLKIPDNPWLTALITLLLIIALWLIYSITSVVLGRSRIDVAPLALAKVYLGVSAFIITVLLVSAYGG